MKLDIGRATAEMRSVKKISMGCREDCHARIRPLRLRHGPPEGLECCR